MKVWIGTLAVVAAGLFLAAPALAVVIHGNEGNNVLEGTDNHDEIYGHGGDDSIFGYNASDDIYGGWGYDLLVGNGGDDEFFANDGYADVIRGGGGTDICHTDFPALDTVYGCELVVWP